MIYKIDYTQHSNEAVGGGSKWVNNVADQTEAVKKFMNWFFETYPNQKIRLEGIMAVEFVGDMSAVDVIDAAILDPL